MTDHWCTYCNGVNTHNCQFNPNLPRMRVYTTTTTPITTTLPPAQQQPFEGEKIMVNMPHDVFTLPLRPSGLLRGPRFVVHVPEPQRESVTERDAIAPLQAEIERLQAEVERLRSMTAVTMGVGSGDGNLFVHGDCESIKAAQAIVLERGALRAEVERLAEALRELEEREQRDEALLRQALDVLSRARRTAMEQTLKARIPECAEFAEIARDLIFVVAALRERLGEKA